MHFIVSFLPSLILILTILAIHTVGSSSAKISTSTTLTMVSAFALKGEAAATTAASKEQEQEPKKSNGNDRLSPWERRWENNQIGWHINEIHDSLYHHGNAIVPGFSPQVKPSLEKTDEDVDTTNTANACSTAETAPDDNAVADNNEVGVRVFVPLCGKTLDMAFLANERGVKEVVGIDGIRKALVEFTNEHPSLEIQALEKKSKDDKFEYFQGTKITLVQGDYFDLLNYGSSHSHIGTFDAIYDRASIVAIQPTLRQQYVQILGQLIQPGGTILLSTLDRRTGDENVRKAGPPFSVDELEVQKLFGNQSWVESITKVREVDELSERFKSQGLTSMFGLTFIIRVKE